MKKSLNTHSAKLDSSILADPCLPSLTNGFCECRNGQVIMQKGSGDNNVHLAVCEKYLTCTKLWSFYPAGIAQTNEVFNDMDL